MVFWSCSWLILNVSTYFIRSRVLSCRALISSAENGAGVDADGAVIVEEIGDVDAVEEVAHAYAALKNVF
jgi:hypothetical protein